jgi:hypothetical protein
MNLVLERLERLFSFITTLRCLVPAKERDTVPLKEKIGKEERVLVE